jgi:hypothetical protein
MDHITASKTQLNNQLIFKFSSIGFALRSDLCYTNRIDIGIHDHVDYVAQLKHGDKIFISVGESSVPIHMIVSILKARDIKVNFYILYEPIASFDIIKAIHSVAIRVFVQNNIYDLPNVHIMPIGIRDCGSIVNMHRGGYYQHSLLEEGAQCSIDEDPATSREHTCVLCFALWTHPIRKICYNLLNDKPFVVNLNVENQYPRNNVMGFHVPPEIVYSMMRKCKYTLAPRGCGVDTHRFYESVYLKSIPIVLRTNSVFDRLYAAFPCLVVNEWSDVTEELLDSSYPECWRKMREFHSRYPRFLTDLDSIEGLLLEL